MKDNSKEVKFDSIFTQSNDKLFNLKDGVVSTNYFKSHFYRSMLKEIDT